MANIIQKIIENDKKQLKKLHKMAEKVEYLFQHQEQHGQWRRTK